MTYARKVDSSQRAIVSALRGVGARVWIVNGTLDLVVDFRGQYYLIDAKGKGTPRTERQREMVKEGWRIVFARSDIEALRAIGAAS